MENMSFPIRYALLGIEEQVGHTSIGWSEPIYEICGYIVSKVYLVGETIEYFKDNQPTKKYRVVYPFPFPAIKGFSRKVFPYRAYDDYVNAVNVFEVFENFEEAKKQANIKNQELERIALSRVSLIKPDWKEQYEKIEKDFCKRMERYVYYERRIIDETQDMLVFQSSSLESLIAKIIDNPDLFYESIALSLSTKERKYILKEIKSKVCSNCMNVSCRIENSEKPIENCALWENLSLIGKMKVLR